MAEEGILKPDEKERDVIQCPHCLGDKHKGSDICFTCGCNKHGRIPFELNIKSGIAIGFGVAIVMTIIYSIMFIVSAFLLHVGPL